MQETVVNIKIANRAYPVTAAEGSEENLRKASQLVNQMLDQLKNNYAVRDLQDVLAMCCLELAHHKVQAQATTDIPNGPAPAPPVDGNHNGAAVELAGELGNLERRIAEYLAG